MTKQSALPSGKVPWFETPLIRSTALSNVVGCNVFLKLENLQPSGSFKSRGIGSLMMSRLAAAANGNGKDRIESGTNKQGEDTASNDTNGNNSVRNAGPSNVHFYSSSGGNAGLGCVHGAVTLNCASTVVVPNSTTDFMISKIRAAGAQDVIREGASWKEADEHLRKVVMPAARERGEIAVYIHPFDDPAIWEGNAGIVHEARRQLRSMKRHYKDTPTSHTTSSSASNSADRSISAIPDVDAIVCSVGGGGLFAGIMQGIDEGGISQTTHVITVETEGADSLYQSVQKNQRVTLPGITSIATSLGARIVCERAFEYAQREMVSSVKMTDLEAMKACRRFLDEERLLVEPACGVCPAICYDGRLKELLPDLQPDNNVVLVICGGSNISLDILEKYLQENAEKN